MKYIFQTAGWVYFHSECKHRTASKRWFRTARRQFLYEFSAVQTKIVNLSRWFRRKPTSYLLPTPTTTLTTVANELIIWLWSAGLMAQWRRLVGLCLVRWDASICRSAWKRPTNFFPEHFTFSCCIVMIHRGESGTWDKKSSWQHHDNMVLWGTLWSLSIASPGLSLPFPLLGTVR